MVLQSNFIKEGNMIVEQYKNHKIKLVEKPHGFAIIRTYEVWKNKELYCKALTIQDAKQKIDLGK
jgi:hypothetical protein